MIDKETVNRRLAALDDYISKLETLKPCTLEELESNFRLRWEVERGLELVCNALLDIVNHLVSSLKLGVPEDQTHALRLLKSSPRRIAPAALIDKLQGMPGFRNILAHEYITIDLEEVHRTLMEDLEDIKELAIHIHRLIARV